MDENFSEFDNIFQTAIKGSRRLTAMLGGIRAIVAEDGGATEADISFMRHMVNTLWPLAYDAMDYRVKAAGVQMATVGVEGGVTHIIMFGHSLCGRTDEEGEYFHLVADFLDINVVSCAKCREELYDIASSALIAESAGLLQERGG